jgi:hypothetical protein
MEKGTALFDTVAISGTIAAQVCSVWGGAAMRVGADARSGRVVADGVRADAAGVAASAVFRAAAW